MIYAARERPDSDATLTLRFTHMPQVAFAKSTTLSTRSALADDFYQLAEMVRRSMPETVVLVARKMPRLCSALSLNFGDAYVISDMAIPLSESILRGRRVAIVDDFINAGSTIDRVDKLVRELGASSVDKFAVATRTRTIKTSGSSHFVYHDLLEPDQYQGIVSALPRVFDTAAEAYDLEFPHIPCGYSVSIPDINSLIELLRQDFGSDVVQRVPGTTRSNARVTLTLPFNADEGLRKIRFYEATHGRGFIVVPISVPSRFGNVCVKRFVDKAYAQIQSAKALSPYVQQVAETDVLSRLELFMRSLGLYREFVSASPIFENVTRIDSLFDVEPATLAFGPSVRRGNVIDGLQALSDEMIRDTSADLGVRLRTSPFATSKLFSLLVGTAASEQTSDPKHVLYSLFSALSNFVCSENPCSYSLEWPYAAQQIKEDPYLRLRIGPTFADLVELLTRVAPMISFSTAKLHVSRFLDAAIDAGVVVPTIGYMDGACYRIYRKGEAGTDDRALKVLEIAVEDCATSHDKPSIPYTDTHVTKVVAALTFSGASPGYFSVKSEARGTVAITKSSVLSDGGDEVGKLLKARSNRSSD